MKKISFAVATILALGAMTMTGCSKSDADVSAPELSTDGSASLVIRYIDTDTVNAKYELAKELNADVQAAYNNLQAFANQKGSELQRMEQTMQQKYNNHVYTSEAQIQAEAQSLAQAQQQAQNLLQQRQESFAQYHDSQLARVNDSLNVFLKDLCQKNGIDAVLPKAVGLYFDEKLDITDAVVDGLNKRYNKYKDAGKDNKDAKETKDTKAAKAPVADKK